MIPNLDLLYLFEGQTMLVCNLENLVDEIWNWLLYTEGKERMQKEVDHFRLVGSSFNK